MKNLLEPVTKIDLDEAFERYDEKNRTYRDDVLTGLDKVMKELEEIREEALIGNHQTEERLTNHEKESRN